MNLVGERVSFNQTEDLKRQTDSNLSTSDFDELEIDIDIDNIIRRLTVEARHCEDRYPLEQKETKALAYIVREIIALEPLVLSINVPIRICGDIHGQFLDLLRIFDLCGYPPKVRYLFLGDYVDRGRRGLEVICLLFAYKIKYPDSIYFLRGNHETAIITKIYGFHREIMERFHSSNVWRTLMRTFNWLPLAAIVEHSIFCCHGGLSPLMMKSSTQSLKEIFDQHKRPIEIPKEGFLCDILWSDPMDKSEQNTIPKGWKTNDRGCSWQFGFDIIDTFLSKYNLDLIVRGHQVVEDGYEFYNDRKLITVFSAPFYGGEFDNAGGIFCLERNTVTVSIIEATFMILKPNYTLANQWFRDLKPKRKKRNSKQYLQ